LRFNQKENEMPKNKYRVNENGEMRIEHLRIGDSGKTESGQILTLLERGSGSVVVSDTTSNETHRITGGTLVTPLTNEERKAMSKVIGKDKGEGKRYSLYGKSVVSVLRWMGSKGFTVAEAEEILKANDVTPAHATVMIQIGRGVKGEGEVADLSADEKKELTAARDVLRGGGKATKKSKTKSTKGGRTKKAAKAEADATA